MSEPEQVGPDPKEWIELAKICQSNQHNRRAMEWKLAFGLWTGIGAFTAAFFLGHKYELPTWPWWFRWAILGAYLALFLVVIFCWQLAMHLAYLGDHRWFIYHMQKARGEKDAKPPEQIPFCSCFRWFPTYQWTWNSRLWMVGECMITFILLALSWFAIFAVTPAQ
ncbi:MAG TPA: hypothetical protein VMS17_09975 [Gemmataceae bacterium]|nr:hypothetical protein [Gemmataceae bacterium]